MNQKTKMTWIILPVLIGSTALVGSAAASTLSDVKADYLSAVNAYQTIKQDFIAAKKQYQQSVNREFNETMMLRSKDFLLNGDTTLLSYLNWMEVKVNATEGLEEGVRSQMMGRISENRAWLLTQQPVIQGANKKSELVDVARTFVRYWDEHDHQYKRYNGYILHARILPVMDEARATSAELEQTIADVKAAGKDVSNVEALWKSYNASIDACEEQVRSAKVVYDGMDASGGAAGVDEQVKVANLALRGGYDHLKIADQTLAALLAVLAEF